MTVVSMNSFLSSKKPLSLWDWYLFRQTEYRSSKMRAGTIIQVIADGGRVFFKLRRFDESVITVEAEEIQLVR